MKRSAASRSCYFWKGVILHRILWVFVEVFVHVRWCGRLIAVTKLKAPVLLNTVSSSVARSGEQLFQYIQGLLEQGINHQTLLLF